MGDWGMGIGVGRGKGRGRLPDWGGVDRVGKEAGEAVGLLSVDCSEGDDRTRTTGLSATRGAERVSRRGSGRPSGGTTPPAQLRCRSDVTSG